MNFMNQKAKRIVVDANIVIAAIFGSRATLVILTSQNYSFYAPRFMIEEVNKHKQDICDMIKKEPEDFDIEFNAIKKFITILDEEKYIFFLPKAEEVIVNRDIKDATYIACALRENVAFIWTNDKDFSVQSLIKTKNTKELIEDNKGENS